MEFAFAAVVMFGHVMPLVPYMLELADRGHRITDFVHDDPAYTSRLRDFGLTDATIIPVKVGHVEEGC
jgi:hypothetical protein